MSSGLPLLPTVEELMAWMKIGEDAAILAEGLSKSAAALRRGVSSAYTCLPVGIYLHATEKAAGVCDEHGAGEQVMALTLHAVRRTIKEAADVRDIADAVYIDLAAATGGDWIKVASTPFLRSVGQKLNFFPTFDAQSGAQLSSPSPVKSMLTSGLVGAGIGYAGGWLGEHLLPDNWRRGRLRNAMAMMGGAIGTAPGLLWGMGNVGAGKLFNDASLLNNRGPTDPQLPATPPPNAFSGPDAPSPEKYAAANADLAVEIPPHEKLAIEQQVSVNGEAIKQAWADVWSEREYEQAPQRPLANINVAALSDNLWASGADPATAGMAMGAIAAARQMPGGLGDSGWVTPMQMGELAARMGAGYLSGAIVGHTLGLLTGMPPETQEKLRQAGLYLGVAKLVVPKLFSR